MDKVSKQFGDNLRRIRLAKKMSQADLGEKLGVDKGYISTLESGKTNPTLGTIGKLATALGMKIENLIISYEN